MPSGFVELEARVGELGRQHQAVGHVHAEGAMARGRLRRGDLLVEQRHPALEITRARRVLEQQEVAPPEGRVARRAHQQVVAAVDDLAGEAGEDQVGPPAKGQGRGGVHGGDWSTGAASRGAERRTAIRTWANLRVCGHRPTPGSGPATRTPSKESP